MAVAIGIIRGSLQAFMLLDTVTALFQFIFSCFENGETYNNNNRGEISNTP